MTETPAKPAQETPKPGDSKPAETKPAVGETQKPAAEQKPAEKSAPEVKTETKVPDGKQPEPLKFELKVPEGSLLDAKAVERISTFAKEKGLTNEQAQAILDSENKAVASYVEGKNAEINSAKEGWVAESKSDKEIGGDSFNKSVELAKRVVTRFGSESLTKALNETGLGNHPEMIRVFKRIGESMSEDVLIVGGAKPAAKKTDAEIFYPKNPENKEN